jgi:ribonuclease HI|tara:strand:- start:3155 stop:3595 length:441 start_codon:yes stop_codon:yes gene_type:complete
LIFIYTDGSCLGNPGTGGWAYTLKLKGKNLAKYGYEKETTNNRMELIAAIKALEFLKEDKEQITIITDSNYLKDGISKWIVNWKKNNWQTANKKPVKNQDLWAILDELTISKKVNWSWVKGHSTNESNNKVDELARTAAENLIQSF